MQVDAAREQPLVLQLWASLEYIRYSRTAAISGKSRGVSSVEKCLRTQNGTCSNEDGGDLQSLDPLITAPDLRSDTAQRAGARLAVALRTPTSSRQGASDPAWRGPERRLTIL
jgi:hypothetical protein